MRNYLSYSCKDFFRINRLYCVKDLTINKIESLPSLFDLLKDFASLSKLTFLNAKGFTNEIFFALNKTKPKTFTLGGVANGVSLKKTPVCQSSAAQCKTKNCATHTSKNSTSSAAPLSNDKQEVVDQETIDFWVSKKFNANTFKKSIAKLLRYFF